LAHRVDQARVGNIRIRERRPAKAHAL
jgi:hypothetical protein